MQLKHGGQVRTLSAGVGAAGAPRTHADGLGGVLGGALSLTHGVPVGAALQIDLADLAVFLLQLPRKGAVAADDLGHDNGLVGSLAGALVGEVLAKVNLQGIKRCRRETW